MRAALVIATSIYDEVSEFRRLYAPAIDAVDLGKVLEDPTICDFVVTRVIDQNESRIRQAIGDFLSQRQRDDFVLIYLSGHGELDRLGRLFFAARDTRRSQLGSTAVESRWLIERLDDCRARRQVLILDCCFSGAFGERDKGPLGQLDLRKQLASERQEEGRGRVVLTASRATERSFEGRPLAGAGGAGSVFTAALIKGIRTGVADTNGDGAITTDEAYNFAYRRLQESGDQQTPQKWVYGGEGTIVIARSPAGITAPAARLPNEMTNLIQHREPDVRIVGVHKLAEWLGSTTPDRVVAARETLLRIAETDSPTVASVARGYLDTGDGPDPAAQPGPAQGTPAAPADPAPRRFGWRRPRIAGLLAGASAILLAAVGVTWTLLTHTAAAPPAPPVRFSFAAHHYEHGLTVTPQWTLYRSARPLLTEKVQLSNPGATALTVTFAEPAPAPVTGSQETVAFTPATYQIVNAGGTVKWTLRVPAHGHEVVGYTWTGATEVTRAQLARWAQEFVASSVPIPTKARLQSLRIRPQPVTIIVGASVQLRLSGKMSNGKTASRADLSKAVWETSRSGIAAVSHSGRVTGKAAGQVRITVRIGAIRVSILLTVSPHVTPIVTPSPSPFPPVRSPTPSPTSTPTSPPTVPGTPPPS
jgi:plastocyanin